MTISEELRERIAAELRSLDGYDMTDGEYIDALADAVGSGASGTLHERLADLVEPQLPESVEWPRFEDGTPVGIGDDVSVGGEAWKVRCAILREEYWALSVERDYDTATVRGDYGERVKRPTPKVLDADGVPIEVGDTVYGDDDPEQLIVDSFDGPGCVCLTLAKSPSGMLYTIEPSRLSHERPDSWERLEADAAKEACEYAGARKNPADPDRYTCIECPYHELSPCTFAGCNKQMRLDIMRRAKALAKAGEVE